MLIFFLVNVDLFTKAGGRKRMKPRRASSWRSAGSEKCSRFWRNDNSVVHVHVHELLQCQVLTLKLWAKTNPEKNSSPSGHWDQIFYCQQEMQHPADGQNKQLEEKCSNIFWNIMRRWVRAHLIMLSWHLEHFSALTSLKAEQIAQLNPSAETNHVNQTCIKPPKESKQHITLGLVPSALVGPISLCQHCNVLTVPWAQGLWGQRQRGLRWPQQPVELCSQGCLSQCKVCAVYSLPALC